MSKKQIKKLTFEDFRNEIEPILNKYGLTNVVIGADTKDNYFWGAFGIEDKKSNLNRTMLSFANAGRLYQSMREQILKQI
jgi:hypothetical protein